MPGGGHGSVSADLRSEPGRVTLQVTADGPALLVLSQAWYPGWQVRIDGVPQGEALRTDYAFQGYPVGAGTHQIELIFASSGWRLGWLIAAITAAVLIILASRLYRKRTKGVFMAIDAPIHSNANNLPRVLGAGLPVLLVFWQKDCAPCDQLLPTLDRLAKSYAGRALDG